MTIREIVHKVNKTKEFEDTIEMCDFAGKAFNLHIGNNWYEQPRLLSYYIGDWQCSEYRIGYKVYFFDNKPVAISRKLGRKMPEEFEWLSKQDYHMVRNYVMTFAQYTIPLADLDEELGEDYKVSFYNQMYKHHLNNAIYNSKHVKIVKHDYKYLTKTVEIEYPDGNTEWVPINELSFPYNLI